MRILSTFIIVFALTYFGFGQRISGFVDLKQATSAERTLASLPEGLIFYEGFDNVVVPNLPNGWTTFSSGTYGFKTGTSGNSLGQSNENGFWPVPAHGHYALSNDDVCNCNKSLDVLISKTFDFSDLNYARIGFSAFQNGSNGQSGTLQIRHTGSSWTDLVDLVASAEWEDYRITIPTDFLKSGFQFRFKYSDNNGYASGLAIDDIFISSTPTENFQLIDYYALSPDVEASGFFPDLIPERQATSSHLQFTAKIENDSRGVKNAHLSVNISGPRKFSDTSSTWLINPQSVATIGLPKRSTFTPYDSGAYNLKVQVITDSLDLDLTDNEAEESFVVSDSIFQWNSDPTNGTGIWMLDSFDRLGSIIQMASPDTIRSTWIGIHPTTEIGARFRVKIFSFQTLTASIFSSAPIQIEEENLNQRIRVEMNYGLAAGKYLIAIEKEAKRLVINTTAAEKSPFGVSYYKSFNQDWRHIGYYPDISMVFDPIDPDCPTHIQADIQDESCPSSNDGKIVISAIGATQFNSKVWSNGAGDVDSIASLTPGFYQVFVTDGDCTYDRIFEIEASEPLEIIADLTYDTCSKGVGSMLLSSEASHEPHKFSINNTPTSSQIFGLSGGQYQISIENDLGCVADTIIKIKASDPLNISINAQPSGCGSSNGKITSNPIGTAPFEYLWSSGDSVSALTGVSAGIYHLSVQDSIGCQQVVTVLLADSNSPNLTLINLEDNSCAGDSNGSISISGSGGSGILSYTWSNSDTLNQVSNLPKGAYYVTVSDTLGCSNFGSYTIDDISKPFAIDLLEEGVNCFGENTGKLHVLIQGGSPPFDYVWTPAQSGTDEIIDLPTGEYAVSVSDNENCQKEASASIVTQPKFFMVIDSLFADSSNNGQNDAGIFLSVFGGTPPYRYDWSNGFTGQDLEQVDTGFYSINIKDQFGCSLYFEKYLSNDPLGITTNAFEAALTVFPNPVLADQTFTISGLCTSDTYKLWDLHGRVLKSGECRDNSKQLRLKNPGIYILDVSDNSGERLFHRIIVQ